MSLSIGIDIPEDHITQKCSMFGVTGTGKSNGVGVILEEYCKKNMPFVCFDVLGAHWGLAEKYQVMVFGGNKGAEFSLDMAEDMAYGICNNGYNHVVFDFSHLNDFEMQEFTAEFLNTLFKIHSEIKTPRHIFVEEAEVFCPQTGFDSSKVSLLAMNKVMKRGRALGLGMTLISQRPQEVNKRTLSQSQATFLLHLEGVPEMKVVEEIFKREEKDTKKSLVSKVANAKKGECVLYSPQWIGSTQDFKFRVRDTFHAGFTPELGKKVIEPEINKTVISYGNTENKSTEKKEASPKLLIGGLLFGVILYILSTVV